MRRVKVAGALVLVVVSSVLVSARQPEQSAGNDPAGLSVAVPAPVQLPGQAPRTYSPAEAATIATLGGDPAVEQYWTPERMASATGG